MDMGRVGRAFFDAKWDPGAGLYFRTPLGEAAITTAFHIAVRPYIFLSAQRFCGVSASLLGLTLDLIL